MNKDHVATAAGALSGIALLQAVDYERVVAGDHSQIGLVIAGVTLIVLGWVTNKVRH